MTEVSPKKILTDFKNYDSFKIVMDETNLISLKDFDNSDSRIIRPKEGDIGYDLIAYSEPTIIGTPFEKNGEIYYSHIDYLEYRTGIFLQHENDEFFSLMFPRSSISNYKLSLANSVAVIDTSYTGEILCRFRYLYSPRDFRMFDERFYFMVNENKIYHKGDKIAQLVFTRKNNFDIRLVSNLSQTSRNDGGFGSTGK